MIEEIDEEKESNQLKVEVLVNLEFSELLFAHEVIMYSEDDEVENLCLLKAYQNQRRLCRLYGSNTKNLKTSQIWRRCATEDNPLSSLCTEEENNRTKSTSSTTLEMSQNKHENNGSNSGSHATVQKFFDRQLNEIDVDIHADNFNISQPWFVGYQNSTSSQGSPLSLAAR